MHVGSRGVRGTFFVPHHADAAAFAASFDAAQGGATLATLADAAERANDYAVQEQVPGDDQRLRRRLARFSRASASAAAPSPLPASDETVAGVPGRAWPTRGAKAATIARRLVVISQAHKAADLPSPTTSSLVAAPTPASAARIGTAQAAKAPALVDRPEAHAGASCRHARRPARSGAAAARLRRRLPPLRARRARRRRPRVLARRADRHPEKIEDGPGGQIAAARASRTARPSSTCPVALAAGLARDGAHRRRAGVQVAGSVSAGAAGAAVGQGRGADGETEGRRRSGWIRRATRGIRLRAGLATSAAAAGHQSG